MWDRFAELYYEGELTWAKMVDSFYGMAYFYYYKTR
jgi:hypothetical protein